MTEETSTPAPRGSTCTCLRLRKASRQVTQIYDHHLAAFGLTVNQYSILGHLRALPGVAISALADVMVMDPTSLTRALGPLQRQGLVRAEPDAQDRRTRRLHLTEDGARSFALAGAGWRKAQAHIEGALGSDGPPAINAALDHLIERLRQAPLVSAANANANEEGTE
ncbi:MAG: MarR family winged helix-turn-helix transcriptional regulator [Hyphomicrobiaceae bacterium]|nr:MarR family winged helix-turn-helix transcriptional regulator [Hyphomicrobiaceae bacterium]